MGVKYNPFAGNLDIVDSPSGDFTDLDVSGDITLDDGGTYTTTVQVVTPTANRTISFPDATGTVALVAGSTGQAIYNNAGALAGFNGLTIDGSGNLSGGGVGTTSPAVAWDVVGQVRASTGILFGTDTAAANALDDYEEGTWTPVIAGQTTAGTGTYSTQVGRYTKVGILVHCVGTLIWTAHTGTGNMRIEGLPFTALNVSELFNAAVFAYISNITMPANTTLMGDMTNNTSRITLRSVVTGGGTPSPLAMDSSGNIYFSITYITN